MPAEIIELRLGGLSDVSSVKTLFDRLFALISERPSPGEDKRLVTLRSRIEGYRLQIGAAHGWPEVEAHTTECLELCQEYFAALRAHLREREDAIVEVIEVLREAVEELARESGDYRANLLGTSDRLTAITEMTDLREIKQRIAGEVESLRTIVAERKKREEETFAKLVRRAETLSLQLEQAREEASRDPLTRISNRGGFDRALDRWIAQHWKGGWAFSLAMLDVDDFKSINDAHGHQIGDRVLTTIAERLQAAIRDGDFVARYGGEEFAVLLDGMKAPQAKEKIEQLLATIARSRFEYQKDGEPRRLQFTMSCGVTAYHHNDTRDDIVQRADEALYLAKHNGKNRVEVKKVSRLSTLFSTGPSVRS